MTTLTEIPDEELASLEEAADWRRHERRAELHDILDEFPDLLAEAEYLKHTRFLTVPEFAQALGWSKHKAYRMLEAGLVPHAFKSDPSLPKSRWLIPFESVALFRERGRLEG